MSGDRKVYAVVGAVMAVMVVAVGVLGYREYQSDQRQGPVTERRPEPAESASATGSPAPSVSVAAVPAAARAQTVAGAEAFIRFFFDEANRALTEPATGLLTDLSDPGCQFCKRAEAAAADLVERDQRYTADPYATGALTKVSGDVKVRLVFAMEQTFSASDIVDVNGSVVDTDPEQNVEALVGVSWTTQGWKIFDTRDNTPYESRSASPKATP